MLKFEIDSLDSIDDSFKALYEPNDGKFRLKVEGIDPADELKNALKKERELNKEAHRKLTEFEKLQLEAETKRLEEKQEFEKLWKSEKDSKTKLQSDFEMLKKTIENKERHQKAFKIASELTRDVKKADLLVKEALSYINFENGSLSFNDGLDDDTLKNKLQLDFPFLVDGNQSSGGNSQGSSSAGVTQQIKRENFEKLSPLEQMKFVKNGGKLI